MKKMRISPEETRLRLIQTGMHLFGLKGFDGTRTRELAAEAGVNQAAIPYHFGGKEGLYLAVAHYVVKRGHDQMEKGVNAIVSKALAGPLEKKEAGHLLLRFFHMFLDNVVLADDLTDRSRFVMREYITPGAGFEVIYNGMLKQVLSLLCLLVGVLVDDDPESEMVVLRANSLFSTVIGNVMTRNLLFRHLGWEGFTPDRVEKLKKIITEIVCQGVNLGEPQHFMESS